MPAFQNKEEIHNCGSYVVHELYLSIMKLWEEVAEQRLRSKKIVTVSLCSY